MKETKAETLQIKKLHPFEGHPFSVFFILHIDTTFCFNYMKQQQSANYCCSYNLAKIGCLRIAETAI